MRIETKTLRVAKTDTGYHLVGDTRQGWVLRHFHPFGSFMACQKYLAKAKILLADRQPNMLHWRVQEIIPGSPLAEKLLGLADANENDHNELRAG